MALSPRQLMLIPNELQEQDAGLAKETIDTGYVT